jgi:TolB-like protein/Tfp pilus assembly protein PilF
VQWAIAYLGAALALAHGAELVGHAFHWPDVVGRVVMIALIGGFPIALTLAWYHGHRGLAKMTQGELAIVSVLLLIGAIFFTASLRPTAHSETATEAPATPAVVDESRGETAPPYSIAVLPFANLSSDPEQEYFADGLSEELLNQLSKIEQLLVTARTSSFAYKGRTGDVGTIGRELRVAHVLEGSVRKAGNQVRITAQLIDTTTGFHLWSETYDGELADVFRLQDEIARRVADALQVTLGIGRAEFRAGGTENTAAYEHYLLARSLLRSPRPGQSGQVRAELEQALALDPEFGLAQAALAQLLSGLASNLPGGGELADERDRAIDRAIVIAPDLPETYRLRAGRYMRQNDWTAAERAIEEMWARSSPNDYYANVNYAAFLRSMGFAQESLPYSERARLLDPLMASPYVNLGSAYDALGDYERAVATYDDMRANVATLVGNDVRWHVLRVIAHGDLAAARNVIEENCSALSDAGPACPPDEGVFRVLLGDADRARAELRAAYARTPAHNALALAITGLFAARFDADLAAEAFGRALLLEPAWLQFTWIPIMEPVRRHPGFKEVLNEMKLVEYWRGSRWPERCRPLGERDFECF